MSNANKLSLHWHWAFWLPLSLQRQQPNRRPNRALQGGAAIHRCVNQAHRQFPGGEGQYIPRSEAYKDLHGSAGF